MRLFAGNYTSDSLFLSNSFASHRLRYCIFLAHCCLNMLDNVKMINNTTLYHIFIWRVFSLDIVPDVSYEKKTQI